MFPSRTERALPQDGHVFNQAMLRSDPLVLHRNMQELTRMLFSEMEDLLQVAQNEPFNTQFPCNHQSFQIITQLVIGNLFHTLGISKAHCLDVAAKYFCLTRHAPGVQFCVQTLFIENRVYLVNQLEALMINVHYYHYTKMICDLMLSDRTATQENALAYKVLGYIQSQRGKMRAATSELAQYVRRNPEGAKNDIRRPEYQNIPQFIGTLSNLVATVLPDLSDDEKWEYFHIAATRYSEFQNNSGICACVTQLLAIDSERAMSQIDDPTLIHRYPRYVEQLLHDFLRFYQWPPEKTKELERIFNYVKVLCAGYSPFSKKRVEINVSLSRSSSIDESHGTTMFNSPIYLALLNGALASSETISENVAYHANLAAYYVCQSGHLVFMRESVEHLVSHHTEIAIQSAYFERYQRESPIFVAFLCQILAEKHFSGIEKGTWFGLAAYYFTVNRTDGSQQTYAIQVRECIDRYVDISPEKAKEDERSSYYLECNPQYVQALQHRLSQERLDRFSRANGIRFFNEPSGSQNDTLSSHQPGVARR